MNIAFVLVTALLSVGALCALIRVVRGPSILDRMIASDVLLTTLLLAVGAEMVYSGHTRTLPVLLVLATTAIFATVTVARYVAWRERVGGDDE
ncbi:MAG: monovalent cation/H+ antiporter complex subunit F [Actinomycetota bacterium]|nr:monovalent cation/H+ antiporter complex subunit F [Actinomycetota bacterium]